MSGADLITQDNDIEGNNIVGYYSGASGYQGFLATPVPEPSVPALLALGPVRFSIAAVVGTRKKFHLNLHLTSSGRVVGDREWLDEATKTIGQFWKRKNARRNGVNLPPEP